MKAAGTDPNIIGKKTCKLKNLFWIKRKEAIDETITLSVNPIGLIKLTGVPSRVIIAIYEEAPP